MLSTVNIIGSGVGYVIPSVIIDEKADKTESNYQFMVLMIVECAISLAGALLVIFLFR